MGEHVAHRGQVVEYDRNREPDCRADKVVDVQDFGAEREQAVVNEEGDEAHDPEFHELCDEFTHGGQYSVVAILRYRKGRMALFRASADFGNAPWGAHGDSQQNKFDTIKLYTI